MSREVVATPLYASRLREFLDEYASRGAVRFVERLQSSHRAMVQNLAEFDEMARVRRRKVGGKTVTLREYVLDAGARDFTVLYWVPPETKDPIVLLNVRIGGQGGYRWTRSR